MDTSYDPPTLLPPPQLLSHCSGRRPSVLMSRIRSWEDVTLPDARPRTGGHRERSSLPRFSVAARPMMQCFCKWFPDQCWSFPGWGESQARVARRKLECEERLWSCWGLLGAPQHFLQGSRGVPAPQVLPASSSFGIFPTPPPSPLPRA